MNNLFINLLSPFCLKIKPNLRVVAFLTTVVEKILHGTRIKIFYSGLCVTFPIREKSTTLYTRCLNNYYLSQNFRRLFELDF